MSVYLFDPIAFTIWEFDCELAEEGTTTIDWTDHPIEGGAETADFAVEKPDNFMIEGVVTATPFDLPYDAQRLPDADTALRTLAKNKQPLTLVTATWAPTIVIETVTGRRAVEDGESLNLSLTCKTIWQPTPTTTKLPPSRLKPSKRARNSAATKGGASTGTQPKAGKTSSWAAKLVDGVGGVL